MQGSGSNMPAVTIPAPIGGWNASSSLDEMPANDALKLVNWIPRAGYVQSRGGFAIFASGLGGPVSSLLPYRGTTEKLLAAANGNIWDVTSGSPVSKGSGFTSNRWQYTNHSTKLVLVNGLNAP